MEGIVPGSGTARARVEAMTILSDSHARELHGEAEVVKEENRGQPLASPGFTGFWTLLTRVDLSEISLLE